MPSTGPGVAIVGAGAVARAIGRLLTARGQPIAALAGRTRARADAAAAFIGGPVRVVELAELPSVAERVLIAVSDQAIADVAARLAAAGMHAGVALHTSGALGPDVLAPLGERGVACGMLHPLQSVMSAEQGVRDLVGITFGVAGDPLAVEWAAAIVRLLDGQLVRVETGRTSEYHAGAVMASNAVAAVLDAAVILFRQAGIDERAALDALGPLARTSLENALTDGPQAAVTGPVVRGDAATVATHLRALVTTERTIAGLYEATARHLVDMARRRGLHGERVREIESLLDGPRR